MLRQRQARDPDFGLEDTVGGRDACEARKVLPACRTPSVLHLTAMPTISSAIAARRFNALRACAENPKGLRAGAYPGTMPTLEAAGLVTRRTYGKLGRNWFWFLTDAGPGSSGCQRLHPRSGLSATTLRCHIR